MHRLNAKLSGVACTRESELVLGDKEFNLLASLVRERTGIVLGANKQSMVYARLVRRLRALKLPGFEEYCNFLQSEEGSSEVGPLINAITTNLTRFFRESHHFDHLRDTAVPEMLARDAGQRKLRIWSSACSTGEEAYSVAMVLAGVAGRLQGWDSRILATDLDTAVLQTARSGTYTGDAVANVPEPLRHMHFRRLTDDRWQIDPKLRALITFNQLNLMGHWPVKGPFDAIFCRNVMIYFDEPSKHRLVGRLAAKLRPGGWLYLGHSETLLDHHPNLRLMGRTIYRRDD